jgi:nickel superoxide dismutase
MVRCKSFEGDKLRQVTIAHAHCDLYCGVYDPAQAKIEALSVLKIAQKYQESDDEVFKDRAILLK